MNSEVFIAVNEEELSNLSIEILDYADRISEILDKYDRTIEKLPISYIGPSSKKLMQYYENEVSPSFNTIKTNIQSYSDDLIALIRKVRENDKELASLINVFTEETKAKEKSVKLEG